MMYVQVKKLPKDCMLVSEYPYPFKFSGDKLYVYEPDVNCFGESIWFRSLHHSFSPLGRKLLDLLNPLRLKDYEIKSSC